MALVSQRYLILSARHAHSTSTGLTCASSLRVPLDAGQVPWLLQEAQAEQILGSGSRPVARDPVCISALGVQLLEPVSWRRRTRVPSQGGTFGSVAFRVQFAPLTRPKLELSNFQTVSCSARFLPSTSIHIHRRIPKRKPHCCTETKGNPNYV